MPRISTDNYDTVASWNGSQDLFIVEQPDGTKVATPALLKQYVLGNSIDDIYSVMGQNGAKNLISYPYYTPDVYTTNGITFTVNEDRSVTATGTATATAQYSLHSRAIGSNNELRVKNGDYIISDGGLQNVNTEIQVGVTKNGVYQQLAFTRNGEAEFTINGDDYAEDSANLQITLVVRTGATTPVTFKPMLRLASDTDETYQPYAKTNRQLTETMGDLSQTGLTGDSVADQILQLNDKFKRLNNIKIIDEDFVILFTGYSDTANRVLCPINFPFAFSGTDYTLTCSRIELVSVGNFTTGISVDTKYRSSALIILSRTSAVGAVFVGRAHIHISRTE